MDADQGARGGGRGQVEPDERRLKGLHPSRMPVHGHSAQRNAPRSLSVRGHLKKNVAQRTLSDPAVQLERALNLSRRRVDVQLDSVERQHLEWAQCLLGTRALSGAQVLK